MRVFVLRLLTSVVGVFRGYMLFWHLLAILLTFIIVQTGVDWQYFVRFRHSPIQVVLFQAVVLGMLVPIVVPLVMYSIGAVTKTVRTKQVALAVAQAALVGWFVSAIYKAFTGRIQPPLHGLLVDTSHGFHFGFWRHGIFWGWPSSHTTVAFATAVAVCVLFPNKKVLRLLSLLYAMYIGLGISVSIHWFSEFVAGAIFGSVVGVVVGKNWEKDFELAK